MFCVELIKLTIIGIVTRNLLQYLNGDPQCFISKSYSPLSLVA